MSFCECWFTKCVTILNKFYESLRNCWDRLKFEIQFRTCIWNCCFCQFIQCYGWLILILERALRISNLTSESIIRSNRSLFYATWIENSRLMFFKLAFMGFGYTERFLGADCNILKKLSDEEWGKFDRTCMLVCIFEPHRIYTVINAPSRENKVPNDKQYM